MFELKIILMFFFAMIIGFSLYVICREIFGMVKNERSDYEWF
jgi:hypothetical protein